MSFKLRALHKASLVKGSGTAEGGGGIPNHGNFLRDGIPHPASPGAPFHKGANELVPLTK